MSIIDFFDGRFLEHLLLKQRIFSQMRYVHSFIIHCFLLFLYKFVICIERKAVISLYH